MTPPARYATFRDAIESQRRANARCAVRAGAGTGCGAHLAGSSRRVATRSPPRWRGWVWQPGDVVGFMLPNGLSALTVFLGAMAGGYVVAPFNLLAQDAQLDYVLGHAQPRRRVRRRRLRAPARSRMHAKRRGGAHRRRGCRWARARRRSPALARERVGRSACDADVHVRHDGRTEGRAAHACEHAVRRCDGRRASATRPRRSRAVVAAALSHQRPVHCHGEHGGRRRQHRDCRTGSAPRSGGRWSNATVRRGSTWCRPSSLIC